jgi:hypothetical protein
MRHPSPASLPIWRGPQPPEIFQQDFAIGPRGYFAQPCALRQTVGLYSSEGGIDDAAVEFQRRWIAQR